jgi:hypothetical protein
LLLEVFPVYPQVPLLFGVKKVTVNYFTRMRLLDPSTKAYKQRRGTYFYYNRAAIGLTCAQATAESCVCEETTVNP